MNAYLILARDANSPPIDAAELLRLERELIAKTGVEHIIFLPPGMFVSHTSEPETEDGDEWKDSA